MFLPKLQFISKSRADPKEKSLASSLFNFTLVLKEESLKNWPNRPESYTNDIKVNPTQKGTDISILLFVYNSNEKNLPRTLREYSKILYDSKP